MRHGGALRVPGGAGGERGGGRAESPVMARGAGRCVRCEGGRGVRGGTEGSCGAAP